MTGVRFRPVTTLTTAWPPTTRQLARLTWLWAIARPAQRRNPGLYYLATADRPARATARQLGQIERAARRFRDAAARVTPDDWRAAAARLRCGGTIPA